MRRLLLPSMLLLYAFFLAVVFTVTYQDQAVTEPETHMADGAAHRPVTGGQEEAEPTEPTVFAEPPPPFDGHDAVYDPTDPPLRKLLHCSTRHDTHRTSRFFTALKAVFRANNLPLTDREPGWNIDEGYAVPLSDGTANYLVAILRGWDHALPGDDTQYLFLLSADGKVLDRVFSSVNARRTRESAEHAGRLRTELLPNPESDGARLIVRFLPPKGETFAGNWCHTVVHGGVADSYSWNAGHSKGLAPAEFEEKGLCRVLIRDGKFVRLFPN